MKQHFLRKGCRVFIAHTLTDAFSTAGRIEPDVVIFLLDTGGKKENSPNDILQHAQGIQLIIVNGDVTFEMKR